MQAQVSEDELDDHLTIDIEFVPSLNYCAFVFGHQRNAAPGSLIDRLWDYKRSSGTVTPESFREIEPMSWHVNRDWYGGSLGLGAISSPKPLSTFELYERLDEAVASMSNWQNNIQLSEKDRFFLREERKSNFESPFVWGFGVSDLQPRLENKEIENRWDLFGSPEARQRNAKKAEQDYEDDLINRSGVWAVEEQRNNDLERQWIEAREFEKKSISDHQRMISGVDGVG